MATQCRMQGCEREAEGLVSLLPYYADQCRVPALMLACREHGEALTSSERGRYDHGVLELPKEEKSPVEQVREAVQRARAILDGLDHEQLDWDEISELRSVVDSLHWPVYVLERRKAGKPLFSLTPEV